MSALDSAIAKGRRRLLPILAICFFLSFLDRVNIGFAALQMNADLGFTSTVFGLGAGIFFTTYILCEIPSNLMLARFGARLWIARIMFTWGLVSAMTAFIWDAYSFYGVRVLLGAAEAGFTPGYLFYLTQWFPKSHRARMTATVQTAVPIATILGAPLSAFLIQSTTGWLGLRGWQWLFIIEGLPSVIMAIVVLTMLPSSPREAKWLTDEERDALTRTLAEERAAQEKVQRFTVMQALFDRRVLLMCLIGFGNVLGTFSVALWTPQVMKSLGGTTMQAGLLTMLPAMLGLCALLTCAWSADRTRERIWHLAGPYLVAAAGFVIAATASSPVWVVVGLMIGSAGISGALPSVWALPATLLTGTASAAALAFINSVGSLGGVVGPLMIGWVRDATGSFSGALLLMAGALVLTACVALLIGRLMRESLRIARLPATSR